MRERTSAICKETGREPLQEDDTHTRTHKHTYVTGVIHLINCVFLLEVLFWVYSVNRTQCINRVYTVYIHFRRRLINMNMMPQKN